MVSSAGWRWSGPARGAHRNGRLPELAVRPALRLRALDPGHHRDALGPQLAEQARAPALAVEHQRQARLLLLRLAALRQQAHALQLRHDAVPDLRHHAGVHLAVQAQQRRPAQGMHPVAGPMAVT